MNIFLWILLAFLIFFVVVMIHEIGHFVTARMVGMRVLEFGLGIPPKIKKIFTDKKWTKYTLNALPIGGFVRIDGEDISKPTAFNEWNFMSKVWYKRFLVLIAGVVMNFVLAWIIFLWLFIYWAEPLSPITLNIGRTNSYFLPSLEEAIETWYVKSDWIILRPIDGSVAQKSGIKSWDIVLSVDGEKIFTTADFITKVSSAEPQQSLKFSILRENNKKIENIDINIIPENGKIWSYVGDALKINKNFAKNSSFSDAIVNSTKEVYHISVLTFNLVGNTLWKLFFPSNENEREEAKKSLSGPVGVANATVMMVENSVPVTTILLFMAILSVNLAIMNILPFPALDGGRIVFTTIYSLLCKLWFSKQKILIIEWYIHSFGFLLLIIFMLYVAGLDISRLFS